MQIEISETGETTIPEVIRDRLGLKAGGAVEIEIGSDGRAYIERAEPTEPTPDRLDRLRGSLKTDMTTNEMMEFLRGKG